MSFLVYTAKEPKQKTNPINSIKKTNKQENPKICYTNIQINMHLYQTFNMSFGREITLATKTTEICTTGKFIIVKVQRSPYLNVLY